MKLIQIFCRVKVTAFKNIYFCSFSIFIVFSSLFPSRNSSFSLVNISSTFWTVCQRPCLLLCLLVNQLLALQQDHCMQRPQVRTVHMYIPSPYMCNMHIDHLLSFPTFHSSLLFFFVLIEFLFSPPLSLLPFDDAHNTTTSTST